MLRSDLWVSAFVRRHNAIGHICVISRRGDPVAGQIFVEIDHLNGEMSLYAPAPAAARLDHSEDHIFVRRFDHAEPAAIRARLEQEARFDPDFWVVSLEIRAGEPGLTLARDAL